MGKYTYYFERVTEEVKILSLFFLADVIIGQCMSDTLMNKINQYYSLRSRKVVNKLLAISLVFLFLNSNELLHFNHKLKVHDIQVSYDSA